MADEQENADSDKDAMQDESEGCGTQEAEDAVVTDDERMAFFKKGVK